MLYNQYDIVFLYKLVREGEGWLVGASLSKPHINVKAAIFSILLLLYMYGTMDRPNILFNVLHMSTTD